MKKLISILLVIACLFTLGACAKKQKPVVTPTPAVNSQEGASAEGDVSGTDENINQGGSESTPVASSKAENSDPAVTATPKPTVDPGVDLEEDILTGDDVVSATPTPTPTQAPSSSGNEDVTPTATPTATPMPTFSPLFDDDTVISLPMDVF